MSLRRFPTPRWRLRATLALALGALAGCPEPSEIPIGELPTPRPVVVVGGLEGFTQDPTDLAARMTVRLRVLGADGPLVASVTVGGAEYTTDAEGLVDIEDLPTAGATRARITAAGYLPGSATLSFSQLDGQPELRVILRAAKASTNFDAATEGTLAYGAFTVVIPAGAVRTPDARDTVYDGPVDLGMDVVVSEGQLIDSAGDLKRRFDLYGLPVSAAGPFLATDDAGTLHHVIPVSAATVSITGSTGEELVVDAASPAQVGVTENRLTDGLGLTQQGALFATSGDDVGSFIPCTAGVAGVVTCETTKSGIAASVALIDANLSCTHVGSVTLSVPVGIEVVERTDTLQAVLPSGQTLPVQTRYALVDGALRLSGAHAPATVRVRSRVRLRVTDASGTETFATMNLKSDDLVSGTLPMDASWTSVDDVHAACAAADWTGAAAVLLAVPDLLEEEEEGEPFTPAPPPPVTTCAQACEKVDVCGTFPSEYGETLEECNSECEQGLADDPAFVALIFECLTAAPCEATAIDAWADGGGAEEEVPR